MDITLLGLTRYRVHRYIRKTPYLIAEVEIIEDVCGDDSPAIQRTSKEMVQLFERTLYKKDEQTRQFIMSQLSLLKGVSDITNFVGSVLGVKYRLRQRLLELSNPLERIQLLMSIFHGELAVLN